MATLRFLVKSEAADQPDSTTLVEWTAAEIHEQLPQFAALFPEGCDDAFPSLTYTTDVYRYTLDPLVTTYIGAQQDERAAAEQASATTAAATDPEAPNDDLPL